ncbi:MAG TPA: SOS response-associated peptidase [Methanomassiliicoccales archaeon]|nr:SOS response-associated peptidase [Methanomassiliicoccales archaeon]
MNPNIYYVCGRFSLGLVYGFSTRFGVPEDPKIVPRYNIAPFQHVPIIVRESPNSLRWMRWGLIPHWAKGEEYGLKLINVRSESALEKPMFKPLLNHQRCLVPATGFYEWQRQGGRRQPFHIRLREQEYFAMAGIYDHWTKGGKDLITFSILTTQANEAVKAVHDRMPVILNGQGEEAWLNKEVLSEDELHGLFTPYPAGYMDIYQVSDLVNDPRKDDPRMVDPYKKHQSTLF